MPQELLLNCKNISTGSAEDTTNAAPTMSTHSMTGPSVSTTSGTTETTSLDNEITEETTTGI